VADQSTQRSDDSEPRSGPITHLVATGFYAGYSPFAPGTAGTLVAIPLASPLASVAAISPLAYSLVLGLAITGAIWAAEGVLDRFEIKDPGAVVCDEIVGYFVTLAFLPVTWTTLLAAFVWFRLFDIVKPPPARRLEGLPGGCGIVLDDVMAGVYANLALRLSIAGGLPVL
jgi:phosphatidylglycerophosphatase A